MNYQCQTVPGDIEQWRQELLEIAYKGGVRGAAVDYLLARQSTSPTAVTPPDVWANIERDAKNGDSRSMARLASYYGDQYALTARDRAIYLNVLSRLAQDGRTEDYSAARIAFYMAIATANEKGLLPQGVSPEKLSLTPQEMARTLVGSWAITDPEGLKRIDGLVRVAKEQPQRS